MKKYRHCIKCGKEKSLKWIKSSYCLECASEKARKWESNNSEKIKASIEKRRLQRQTTICAQCNEMFFRLRGEKVCSLSCKLINEKIVNFNGCWIAPIIGSRGYGNISFRGMKGALSHRISYKQFKGEIPNRLFVCHKCDTPACYNPDHLFLGTPKENIQDGIKKGRIKHIGAKDRNCKFTNLIELQIQEMRLLHAEGFDYSRLSRIFNCSVEYIRKIIKFKCRI